MHIAQKDSRYKTICTGIDVTLAAFRLCRDMIDLLALCDNTVMARRTDVSHNRVQMIKARPGKVIKFNNVTIRAVTCGDHVITAFSGADSAVVARRTVI